MMDVKVVGSSNLRCGLNFNMPVVEYPSPYLLVVGHIINLVKGAFFGKMIDQPQFIDYPEIGDYPDVDFPGKIFQEEIKYTGRGSQPAPVNNKTDKIGRNQSYEGQTYRTSK